MNGSSVKVKSRFIFRSQSALHSIAYEPNIPPFLLQFRVCRQTPTTHMINICEPSQLISIKYRSSLHDDGSFVIRNMLE